MEIEYHQALAKNTCTMDKLMESLKHTEAEYLKFNSQKDQNKTFKQDYYKVQSQVLLELFKKMMKCLLPLNLKSFDNHQLFGLNDITNFESFDELFEKIIQNQMALKDHLQVIGLDNTVALPIKHFVFLEQLKQFSVKFKELVGEVKKLTI